MNGGTRSSGVAATLRNPPNFFIPIMLDVILIFSGNEVLESSPDPFICVDLFSLLFVVHCNSMVVLEVILELLSFLELFEEELMKLILARAVLGVHAFKNPVK